MTDLEKTTEYSESRLYHLPDNKLLSVSKAIIKLTEGKEAELAEHGLTADEITNAGAAITGFEEAITARNAGAELSSASIKSLDALISETSGLLEDRVDRYAKKLKKNDPDFYNRYEAARVIVDIAATHNTNPEPETGEPAAS